MNSPILSGFSLFFFSPISLVYFCFCLFWRRDLIVGVRHSQMLDLMLLKVEIRKVHL